MNDELQGVVSSQPEVITTIISNTTIIEGQVGDLSLELSAVIGNNNAITR